MGDPNDAEKENTERPEAEHTEKKASTNAEKQESEDTKPKDFGRAETINSKGTKPDGPVKDTKQHIIFNNAAEKQKITNTKKEDSNTLPNKDTTAEEKKYTKISKRNLK